mgnify:CR=1 FL=1
MIKDPAIITKTLANYYGISTLALYSPTRSQQIVKVRHLAIYICRILLGLSYPSLSVIFKRDRSSLIHAIRRIKEDLEMVATANMFITEFKKLERAPALIQESILKST